MEANVTASDAVTIAAVQNKNTHYTSTHAPGKFTTRKDAKSIKLACARKAHKDHQVFPDQLAHKDHPE